MPAARGVKRTASKASASTAPAGPKNKKKRNVVQLEVPTAPAKRGKVLTCGQGDVGQLGLGDDVMETNKFKLVSELGDKIVDVCAGGMHTVALDTDGKVWTFGCNDEGALGRTTSGEADEAKPAKVALPLPAVQLAAGDSHTAALLQGGDVYAWGSFRDSHGSMGLVLSGREGKASREPVRVALPEPAVDIASGGDHLAVLTTSGSVYTMGCGEQGQLGRLSQRSASRDTRQKFSALLVPAKVTLKGGASRLWAGYHATFVLDGAQEKVIAWGLNNYGQLGVTGEKRRTALYSPTECDAFTAVGTSWNGVACGQHHSLALDGSGQVYSVGRCEYGRLGLGPRTEDALGLEPVPSLQGKRCVSIAAGTSSSFAVSDSGEVFGWGMGSEGQLGSGRSDDADAPTPARGLALEGLVPRRISAGGQHTVLFAEDPSAKKEPSPAPEKEAVEETEDIAEEEPEPEPEKKPKGRAAKRQKKQEQEDEISSTSSAQPIVEETKPKVNGDEKVETPTTADETDSGKTKSDAKESTPMVVDESDSVKTNSDAKEESTTIADENGKNNDENEETPMITDNTADESDLKKNSDAKQETPMVTDDYDYAKSDAKEETTTIADKSDSAKTNSDAKEDTPMIAAESDYGKNHLNCL